MLNALPDWRAPRRLSVALSSASYDVVIGEDLLARAGARWRRAAAEARDGGDRRDGGRLHLPTLMRGLAETVLGASPIVVPAGEASKNLATWRRWWISCWRLGLSGAPR